jgi:hypothetical protein
MHNATDVVDLVSREAARPFSPEQVVQLAAVLGQIAGINASNT